MIRRLAEVLTDRTDDLESGTATFVPVENVGALEHLFEDSFTAPVVLLLNDPYCSISGRAYRRVAQLNGDIHVIDVSRQHELKRAVATRTGVRHESPQAFVLRAGAAIWHASHGDITAERIITARNETGSF